MNKKIELNKNELNLLSHLIWDCNPCEAACLREADTGHFPRYRCEDRGGDGEYKCPYMKARSSLMDKLGL